MDRETGAKRQVAHMVMEMLPGGEVFDLIFETGALPAPIVRRLFRQMLMGVQHMHSRGKAHRDLKLENMMFGRGNKLVLIDFGFVCDLHGSDKLVGTGFH